jgi:hypothetical protein
MLVAVVVGPAQPVQHADTGDVGPPPAQRKALAALMKQLKQ